MRPVAAFLILGFFCSSAVIAAAKDYHDKDLKGQNFSGAGLDGANFADAILTNANFSKASLKKTNFRDATIANTTFQNADLTGADFRGALGEGNFDGATLTDANLEGLSFTGSALGDCNCRGANFRKAKIATAIYRSDFRGADFSSADLHGAMIDTRGVVQWKGAIYDQNTIFPPTFDPEAAKMVLIKTVAPEPPKEPKASIARPPVAAQASVPPPAIPAQPAAPVIAPPTIAAPVIAPAVATGPQPPQTPAPAKPAPEPGKLIPGWVVATSIGLRNTLVCTPFWFRPNGTAYFGNPNGAATDADFAALQKSDPANCGTYHIDGAEITLQSNGGKPVTLPYNGYSIGSGFLYSVHYFTPDEKLDGVWITGAKVVAGAASAAASSTWVFRPDGTFDTLNVAAINNASLTRNGGDEAGQAARNHGTYAFTGHQVTLKFADGTSKTVDTFGTDVKPSKPYILGLDGNTLHNAK